LADEAAAQLRGASRGVTTSPEYRVLPIESRGATWHMGNWYRPIREWYADENPALNYRSQSVADGVVLEIGLLNYEWHTHRLVVQVVMRLVDVETGRVIGRARHAAYPKIGRAVEILATENAALKRVFIETARPLVSAGLTDLGLLDQYRLKSRPYYPVVVSPTPIR
jgi:hypothetical protein